MKKKFWNSEKVVSFSAIFISVMSLFIFKQQTDIIEDQSHRSVMPYLLQQSSNRGSAKEFDIFLVNHGVGPAIIEEREIIYKGTSYNMELHNFLWEVVKMPDSVNVIDNSSLTPGYAIPAGSARNLVTVGGNDYSYNEFLRIMDMLMKEGFQYRIKYRSIYDDRWEINSETNSPVLIEE